MTLSAAQAADTLTQVGQLAGRLRGLEPQLRRRAADGPFDGYSPHSGLGVGGGHGGDPTGTVAAMRVDHPGLDTLGQAHHRVLALVDQARRLLEQAESVAHQVLPPVASKSFDDGCVSCVRVKAWSPISRARRCRWCSDWAYGHGGEDPPIDLLRAHHEGRRVTVRLTEAVRRHR